MTDSQSPLSPPETHEPQPPRRFKRLPLVLGVVVLAGVGGATVWAWRFVDRELVPLVTRQLSKTLNRPILLGDIERLSLTGVRLGASAIPATPTDSDRAAMEAVEVKFNPLQVLWRRRLGLRVILVKPTVYIEQDANGTWVTAQIQKGEKKGWLEIALDRLEFDNGTVMLSSPDRTPKLEKPDNKEDKKTQKEEAEEDRKTETQPLAMTTLRRVKGGVEITDNNELVRFEAIGYPLTQGRLRVQGEYLIPSQDVKLIVSGQDIPAAEVSPLLTQTPLKFSTGKLYGNVGIQVKVGQGKTIPKLEGNARFENIDLQIQGVPQPLNEGKGKLRFGNSAMLLEEANANYGKIPVRVPQGILDFQQGYELPVQVPPADIALILDTLQLETPVPVTGEAEAVLKVIGPLNAPVLIGEAQSTDVATIDRVPFSKVSGNFGFSVAEGKIEIGNIKALPDVGGEVQGVVLIQLPPKLEDLPNSNLKAEGKKAGEVEEEKSSQIQTPNPKPQTEPEILAEFVAQDVPGDAIAQLYGATFPNNISLGLVNAKSTTVGAEGKLETQIIWEALNGTYPAKGEMEIAGTTAILRNTLVQVEDSIVRAGAIVTPQTWQVALDLNNTPIAQFLPPDALPGLTLGAATGQIQLASPMGPFDLNRLQGLGQIELGAAGGNLQIVGQFADGQWEAQVAGNQVELAQFIPPSQTPPFPLGTASGRFNLYGSSLAFDPNTLEAKGEVLANVAGGGVQANVTLAGGRWQADVSRFELPLTPFIPSGTLPEDAQAIGRGTFAGRVVGFDLNSLQANALVGVTFAGGIAEGTVRLADGRWQADISQYQIPLTPFIPPGTLPGDAQATGRGVFVGNLAGFDLANLQASTDVSVAFANGGAQGRVNLAEGRWSADVSRFQVPLSPFLPANMLPPDAQAVGNGTFVGNLSNFNLANLQANANTIVTFAEDKGAKGTVTVADGRWSANLEEFLIPLAPFVPPGTLPEDAIASGNGRFSGRVDSFEPASLQANADVGVAFKGGGAQGAVTLADNRWSASFDRLHLPLAPYLPPDLPLSVETLVNLGQKPLTVAGAVTGFAPENLTAEGAVGLLAQGGKELVASLEGRFDRGNWNADVAAERLPIASLFPRERLEALTRKQVALNLQGDLAGRATLAGTLTDFTPQAIAAALNPAAVREGGLELTNLKLNESTFDTVLAGPLQQTPEGLVVSLAGQDGSIVGERDRLSVLFESPKKPGQAWSYLPLAFQGDFDWNGEENIDCAVGGEPNPPAPFPVREGGVALPSLEEDEGSESPSPGGGETGEGSPTNCRRRNIALEERTYRVSINGTRKGNILTLNLNDLPLSPFALKPPTSSQLRPPITGAISTDLTWDLARGTGGGRIAIDRPTIGFLAANSLASQFQYTGNGLELRDTALRKGESEYRLSARLDHLQKDPQFDGNLQISRGRIQDVLTALQWFDLDDFARGLQPAEYSNAAELDLDPAGNPNAYSIGIPEASLFDQLRRFSEVKALLEQERTLDDAENPLPKLAELQGEFNGTIAARGSVARGADLEFDLHNCWGQLQSDRCPENDANAYATWIWGTEGDRYLFNQIIAKGSLRDGSWNFQNFDIRANLNQETETVLEFAGQVGGEQQSAQFNLTDFPSTVLEKFFPFPGGVSISGNLNARATLAGSFTNPQARGEITLDEGFLNEEAIDRGFGSFLYSNGRLDFGSQVFVEGDEPIKIGGNFPYQFPGSTVALTDNTFSITASVRNEGLTVLNFLTDAVKWEGGEGEANLIVSGTRSLSDSEKTSTFANLSENFITQGEISLTNAQISSPNLPEPLTGVTGTATLDDRGYLIVDNIQGNFEQGQVTAQGVYPLLGFSLAPEDGEQPLTLNMNQLKLDLKGRYEGGIDGKIVIRGSFLNPEIGGQIFLRNGQILLPDQTAEAATPLTTEPDNPFQPIYTNLNLILGERIQILKPPVLNFIADGALTVNGSIDAPTADGKINLRQGLVNIFTTEFTLARNYPNTATFDAERGIDPNLNVLMRASVQEASHSPLSQDATTTSTEVEELAIERGTLETVRIEAKVNGLASQLAENLELSSSPKRSQREIVALMGGGFINTLGTGDSTLALANLASSVLLTQFQTALNQALGLQDFRLFPTTTARTSSLTLGAELGINITDNVSASVLRVLDAKQPTRFGVRYRIDDNILLRGSTDFDEDTRGEIEIRFRF